MKTRIAGMGAVFCTLAGLAGPAAAQDLASSISCLTGRVPANDWAELAQRVRESSWDRRGGVALTSSIGNVRLRVVDPNNVSVCEETANNSTACTFRVDLTNYDYFNIVVDNQLNGEKISYKICAY